MGDRAPASQLMEGAYRVLMKRNSVYVAFILVGALAGERVINYSIDKVWEANNKGKRFEDIPNLGQKTGDDE
ncbi:ubiquinol-cytochrome c reductase subunit 9 [Klebsormidium nitens]|uniref:Complex III subunit 9 n=1 Tax=Klebsormidium nitens TaxID=105231 RepID=A0A1Y1I2I4_KLENI|nr:ubiquinol-cytochrome c reductase subunit 9 [Klebsormidium nitens]|eukprot:GAQ85124.1 ubiquinol-cytochrome c reductase subunit 9 [Klebsormidium nitens]